EGRRARSQVAGALGRRPRRARAPVFRGGVPGRRPPPKGRRGRDGLGAGRWLQV
ncbi:MAG: hypothetical protein AVDCRST_MAG05-3352, partial [uncultured Rubrobacteraceae bacterium]